MAESDQLRLDIVIDPSQAGQQMGAAIQQMNRQMEVSLADLTTKVKAQGREIGESVAGSASKGAKDYERWWSQTLSIIERRDMEMWRNRGQAAKEHQKIEAAIHANSAQGIAATRMAELTSIRERIAGIREYGKAVGKSTDEYHILVAEVKALEMSEAKLLTGNARGRGDFHRAIAKIASATFEATGAFYGLATAAAIALAPAALGVNLSKQIEDTRLGIASILVSMGEIKGIAPSLPQALTISSGMMDKLVSDSMKFGVSIDALANTLRATMAPGLAAGMSLDQIQKVATIGTIAVKTIGLDSRQTVQEIRDLVAGGITAAASTLATSLGISDSDIKRWREAGTLYDELMRKTMGFQIAASENANTLSGSWDILKTKVSLLLSSEAGFNALKDIVKGISDYVGKWDEQTNQMEFNPALIDAVSTYWTVLKNIASALGDIGKILVTLSPVIEPVSKAIKIMADNVEASIALFIVLKRESIAAFLAIKAEALLAAGMSGVGALRNAVAGIIMLYEVGGLSAVAKGIFGIGAASATALPAATALATTINAMIWPAALLYGATQFVTYAVETFPKVRAMAYSLFTGIERAAIYSATIFRPEERKKQLAELDSEIQAVIDMEARLLAPKTDEATPNVAVSKRAQINKILLEDAKYLQNTRKGVNDTYAAELGMIEKARELAKGERADIDAKTAAIKNMSGAQKAAAEQDVSVRRGKVSELETIQGEKEIEARRKRDAALAALDKRDEGPTTAAQTHKTLLEQIDLQIEKTRMLNEMELRYGKEIAQYGKEYVDVLVQIDALKARQAAGGKITREEQALVANEKPLLDRLAANAAMKQANAQSEEIRKQIESTKDKLAKGAGKVDYANMSVEQTKAMIDALSGTRDGFIQVAFASEEETRATYDNVAARDRKLAQLKELLPLQQALATQAQMEIDTKASDKALKEIDKFLDPSKVTSFTDAFKQGFDGMDAAFKPLLTAFDSIMTKENEMRSMREKTAALTDPTVRKQKEIELDKKANSQKISGMQEVLGATKGFFGEQQKGFKVIQAAEQAYRAWQLIQSAKQISLNAVEGVTKQASGGDPYTAFFRMAAMAAAMASLGAAVSGLAGGGGGGMSAEQMQKTQGTGTVFGDSTAKSTSVKDSIDLMGKATLAHTPLFEQMMTSLKSVDLKMGAFTAAVGRTLGMGSATGDLGIAIGSKSNAPDIITKLRPLMTGPIDPIGDWLISSIFGKTSTSIIDKGLQGGGTIGQLRAGGGLQQYGTGQTTTSAMFGMYKTTDTFSTAAAAPAEITKLLGNIFADIADTAKAGAVALGGDAVLLQAAIDSYSFSLGKLSLQGMTGAAQQEAIMNVISSASDRFVGSLIPSIAKFQQVGEGMLQTLTRVVAEVSTVDTFLGVLGVTIKSTADSATTMVTALGGLDKATQLMTSFVSNFAPAADKSALAFKALDAAMTANGMGGVAIQIRSASDYFKVMQRATDSQKVFLLQQQENAMTYIKSLADMFSSMFAKISLSMSAFKTDSGYLMGNLQSLASGFRGAAVSLSQSFQQQMNPDYQRRNYRQSMATISQAYSDYQRTGIAPSAAGLQMSLQAVSGSTTGMYASTTEWKRGTQQTINMLGGMGTLADAQLTIQQQMASSLDKILSTAQEQLASMQKGDSVAAADAGARLAILQANFNMLSQADKNIVLAAASNTLQADLLRNVVIAKVGATTTSVDSLNRSVTRTIETTGGATTTAIGFTTGATALVNSTLTNGVLTAVQEIYNPNGTLVLSGINNTGVQVNAIDAAMAGTVAATADVLAATNAVSAVTKDTALATTAVVTNTAATVAAVQNPNAAVSVQTAPGAAPSTFQKLLGALTGVASTIIDPLGLFGGGGLFSDPRAKENINFTGKTKNGFNLYDFSYKNDPSHQMYRGVMSTEVAKSRPDAVIKSVGMFDRVNYDALGIKMEKLIGGKPVPMFAAGGTHAGGWRIVGEQGPELEYTGPSRITSNGNSKALFDTSSLVAELRQLRAELQASNVALIQYARDSSNTIYRWEHDGMPEVRTV